MSAPLVFKRDAAAEAEAAYLWYESRNPGLGSDFLLALDACLARIQRHPEAAQIIHQGVRRALLRRFPYAVLYLTGATITVYAVFHCSRNPEKLSLH